MKLPVHILGLCTTPLFALMLLLALPFAWAGCSAVPSTDAGARLAVVYATLKLIEADAEPVARARKVAEVAQAASRFLDTAPVTVAELSHAMRQRLPADLSPADRLLAWALIDAVAAELSQRVGAGLLDAEKQLAVNTVLAWVLDAAGAY